MAKKFGTLFFLTITLLFLSSCSGVESKKSDTQPGSAARDGGTYLDQPLTPEVLDAPLFDSEGNKFNFRSLKGKYVVLANFLTSCQEICPMTSVNIRDIGEAIQKGRAKNKVEALVLSIDSQRDQVPRLRAYKELFGDGNWKVASGSRASLDSIWKFFGAPAKQEFYSEKELNEMPVDWQTGKPNTYDMVHADLVIIVDDKGSWRWLNLGSPKMRGKEIPAKMKAFLSSHGLENLVKPEEPTWSIDSVISALNELTGHNIK